MAQSNLATLPSDRLTAVSPLGAGFRPQNYTAVRRQLREMAPEIKQTAPDFNLQLGSDILEWALKTNYARGLPKDELFSDPLVLTKALVDLVGADSTTLYAAMLYPSIRPLGDEHFDRTLLDQVSELFKGGDGVIDERYSGTRDTAINALQVRACDLIAPPARVRERIAEGNSAKTLDAVFDKPNYDEAQNLAAFYIMVRNVVQNEDAFAIRATQWYLRLVDMRENPRRYTEEQKLQAYYYTDKFYAPFCEYLALQQLKDNPDYSPVDEKKGLYRLKVAMEEELIRQVNPEAYHALQAQLLGFIKGFEVGKNTKHALPIDAWRAEQARHIINRNVDQVLKAMPGIREDYIPFYKPLCEHLAFEVLRNQLASPGAGDHLEWVSMVRPVQGKSVGVSVKSENVDVPLLKYEDLQSYLGEAIHSLQEDKGRKVGNRNKKHFDIVSDALKQEVKSILAETGVPAGVARTEVRLKKPRSLWQKVLAKRNDIHDYVGIRVIFNVENQEQARRLTGKVHAAFAKRFEEVKFPENRYKNFYTNPRQPDDGYRCLQNTVKMFGMDVELQLVDRDSHINNTIGSASHFFHKLVGSKKGEKSSGITIPEMMEAFTNAGSKIVVRVAENLVVLSKGALVSSLVTQLGQAFTAASAVVTDHDPLNRMPGVRVPLRGELRNGQIVQLEGRSKRLEG